MRCSTLPPKGHPAVEVRRVVVLEGQPTVATAAARDFVVRSRSEAGGPMWALSVRSHTVGLLERG